MMLKHIASTTVATAFAALCGVVLSVVTSRLLGVSGRGELALVLNAVGLVFPLTCLGVKQATAYFIGKEQVPAAEMLRMQALLAPSAGILTTLGALVVLSVAKDLSADSVLVAFILVNSLGRISFDFLCGIFLAQARIYELNLLTLIRATLELSAVGAMLLLEPSTESYLAGSSIAYLAASVAALVLLRTIVRSLPLRPPAGAARPLLRVREVLRKGLLFALPMFIMGLNYGVDVAMLGALASSHAVGLYAVAVTFITALWYLPNIVNLVVFSHGVTVAPEQAHRYSRAIFRNGLKVMLLALPVVAILGMLASDIIRVAFGGDFVPAGAAVLALLPGGYLMLLFKLFNGDLAARGRPEVALRSFVLALVVNIAGNWLLIPPFGHVGAAIASSISYSLGATWFLYLYLRVTRAHVA